MINIDILKSLKGIPAEIPNSSRDDLPQLFIDLDYKIGAEIGVDKGEFSVKFARVGLKIFAIDPWRNYHGYLYSHDKEFLDLRYQHTKDVLNPYPDSKVIRKTSMEALDDFNDNSLDFVYIDANHRFRFIAEDISEWSKKVKSGGTVAGHDYVEYFKLNSPRGVCDVIPVVKAYTQAFRINNWYILGDKDEFKSWMYIKP